MGRLYPPLPTGEAANWGLSRFSKIFLEAEFCELRL